MNSSQLDLIILKFLIETSGHVWTASELMIQSGKSKSCVYRSLAKLSNHNLITNIGNTFTFNLDLLGKERNITELRKNFKRIKQL